MKKYKKPYQYKFLSTLFSVISFMFIMISLLSLLLGWSLSINGLNYSVNIHMQITGSTLGILLGVSFLLLALNIKFSISLISVCLVLIYISNIFHPLFTFKESLFSLGVNLIIIISLEILEYRKFKQ